MGNLVNLKKDLRQQASPKKSKILASFFKTGQGQYGEGDKFLGVTVPVSRQIAKKYLALGFVDLKKILASKIHEERLVALLILVARFDKGGDKEQKQVYKFYLQNTEHINNWDLVDLSAPKIVGKYLLSKDRKILLQLAKSKSLWERRIAILSTFSFIYVGESAWTFGLAKILMNDKHDLIHKAVGWMLREVGKRVSEPDLRKFLDVYRAQMPRTMLRYSIERLTEDTRRAYLD